MINTQGFMRNCSGDPSIVIAFSHIFLHEYPLQLAAIERALRENDHETMRSMAHQLRGSLALMDARDGLDAAESVELAAAGGAVQAAAYPVKTLRAELSQLDRQLRQLIADREFVCV